MNSIKKNFFKKEQVDLAVLFRTLGLPSRIAILEAIANHPDCVNEFTLNVPPLANNTVIQHIRSLKREGIIIGNFSPSKTHYCIDWENLDYLKSIFDELYTKVKQNHMRVAKMQQSKLKNTGQ